MTRIKICGLTNLEDALVAAQAGADLLGFIFYEPSPRYVSPATVADIVSTLKAQAADDRLPKFVGVFVNALEGFVQETMRQCDLDLAQLHGDESPDFLNGFAGRAFKALKPQTLAEAQEAAQTYQAQPPVEMIFLDAYHPHLHGGTGNTADWGIAAHIAQEHRLLLAGGLNPENVSEAIQQVRPWGVDVSSGVEAAKGKKDHAKVKAFIEAVRVIDG